MEFKYTHSGIRRALTLSARGAIAAVALALPLMAGAIPAKKGVFTVENPDGTKLRVEKFGNAFSHAVYTDDGILLQELDNGQFVYATIGPDGLPAPSTVTARAAEYRTESDLQFLSTFSRDEMQSALELRDASLETARKAPRNVMSRARATNPGLCRTTMPNNTGSPRALVILVEYKDEKFRTENAHEYFNNSLNQEGFSMDGGTGSVLDYFTLNSLGKYTPQFDLYGPVTLEKNMSYYGQNDAYGNDRRPHKMVIEACQILDETTDIDFSVYDNNGDGIVDNVFVYYAGFGEANSVKRPTTVWPHSHDITALEPGQKYTFDGVIIDHYACTNEVYELYPSSDTEYRVEGIGTFVHEFSHVLGLPDLYETSYATGSFTPGGFQVLDYGPYNNDGRTPPNYSAFERYALGWIEPKELKEDGEKTLKPIVDTNTAYIINTPKDNEFYLLENRVQEGWDKYIPAGGMIVWHVDFVPSVFEMNVVNNSPRHQYVDLIEADGVTTADTRNGDTFPGSQNVTEFGFSTMPQLASWAGKDLMREISDIRIDGRNVKFSHKNTDPEYVPSAVDGIQTTVGSVTASGNVISSTYETPVDVYDSLGRKAGVIAAGGSLEVTGGLYIAVTPAGSVKLMVK